MDRLVLRGTAPSHVSIPRKSKWYDGQRRINEAGKCIRENTALRTKFISGVRIQAVCLEFAYDRSGTLIGTGGTRRADWPA